MKVDEIHDKLFGSSTCGPHGGVSCDALEHLDSSLWEGSENLSRLSFRAEGLAPQKV